jgi:nitroreductase
MSPADTTTLLSQLNWRYATKKFDATKVIPDEIWDTLEETLRLTPSSFGLQPWRFIVVKDKNIRAKLQPCSWNQPQITEASHMVVFAAQKEVGQNDVERLISTIMQTRGISREAIEGYRQMMLGFVEYPFPGFDPFVWTSKQTYIALGNLLTSAALLGIDACPMEGFDAKAYDEILNCSKDGFWPTVVATLGYRALDDNNSKLPKVRYSKEDLIIYR